jgi:MFS transporter, PPP family, 3-phenylpropionic acid transporter
MRWIRLLYVANGAIYGTWGAFSPVVLTWHGFDAPLVALTGSLGSIAFWLSLPVWGHLGDKVVGTRRALQLTAIPTAILILGLELPLPALFIVLLCVLGSATGGAIGALTDAHTVAGLADPEREYGKLRMLGSLGAGVFAIGFGLLYDHTGYMMVPIVGGLAFVSVALVAVRLPLRPAVGRVSGRFESAGETEPRARTGRFGSLSEALHGRPRLILILVGCLGIFMGIMGGGTFITLRLQALGGGPSTIGFANGIGSSAEVPGMFLASWLVVRYGVRPVMGIAAFGLACVFGGWALTTDPLLIAATKILGGVMFAGVTVSFVVTMASILPQRLVSTGQTLYQSVAFGAAAVLSNFIGAILYKLGGAELVFAFLACATAAGGVISVLALPSHGRIRRVTDEDIGAALVESSGAVEPMSADLVAGDL